MNLVADEGIDLSIVERLREDGYSVSYIAEISPAISDNAVLERAISESALLITADKDFGELIYRQRLASSGVVLIRLSGLKPLQKAEIVAKALKDHGEEMYGQFAVVAPGSIRIRKIAK